MTSEPARRAAVWLLALAAPVTAVASLALVVAATASADVDGARHGSATGRAVRLAEPGGARTGIDVEAMLPGRTAHHCVVVWGESGAGSGGVVMFLGASSGALVDHLDLSVGYGGVGAPCAEPGPLTTVYAGPLAAFGGELASGVEGHRVPEGGGPVPYVIEVTLDEHTPNGAQGASARLDVVWEVRGGAAPR